MGRETGDRRLSTSISTQKSGIGLLLTAAVYGLSLLNSSLQAADAPDQALIDFLHARGEPALIGANAEHELALTAYRPIPAFNQSDIDADKLRLGFDLFHERRLSVDNSTGCNSCHSGMFGGTDGLKVSTGANGARGNLNSPTTFNAAFNFRQFWDGRSVTLADQALGPITNQLEMAHDLSAVLAMLQEDTAYATAFAANYPDGVSINNMADAIAYFQTVNFTRASTPFVRHLAGEESQLSEQAMRGWKRFDEIGCASCHNGINLGGNSYQQLGSTLSYFFEHREAGPNDSGLIKRSGRDQDIHVFKVPTLHGVAETAPYFHDGSIETLEAAIEEMGEHQLGRILSEEDTDDIAAFLRSLGGRPMGMAMGGMNMGQGQGQGMRMGQGMNMENMRMGQGQGQVQGQDQGMRMGQGQGMRMGQGMNMGQGQGMRMGGGMNSPSASEPAASSGALKPAIAAEGSHEELYRAAIATTAGAQIKLLNEMSRINRAEIAHFDFLQYQHLELIRHARALHYPPAQFAEDTRGTLKAEAERLLAETDNLEWMIADFLRAEAMSRILNTHLSNPETSELADQLGDVSSRLGEQQQTATAMIRAVGASPIAEIAARLEAVYPTLN
jgi:cytochrome c peroxidase